MKYARLGALVLVALVASCNQEESINVNSRYTVEKIEVKILNAKECKLSEGLRKDMSRLIGQKFDQGTVSLINKRVREELKAAEVVQKLSRGDKADHVIVTLDVMAAAKSQSFGANASSTRSVYHSRQGWSGQGEITLTVNGQPLPAFGLIDDGDQLTERYAGLTLHYERQLATPPSTSLTTLTATSEGTTTTTTSGTTTTTVTGNVTKVVTAAPAKQSWAERLKPGFLFEDFHIQWNPSTLAALDLAGETSEIYRTRQNFQPTLTLTPIPAVTATVGVSFERFQNQFPAAHTGAANAVVTTLRYHRQLGNSDTDKRTVDAGYSLRAATRIFASDYVYARHLWDATFTDAFGKNTVTASFTAGLITGRAPLFERYMLGNSSTLRGWSKYDIAPRGATRLAYSSVDYRYRFLSVFYDTGSVWSAGENSTARHSAGVALQVKYLPAISVAFPIRAGRAEPVFMMTL